MNYQRVVGVGQPVGQPPPIIVQPMARAAVMPQHGGGIARKCVPVPAVIPYGHQPPTRPSAPSTLPGQYSTIGPQTLRSTAANAAVAAIEAAFSKPPPPAIPQRPNAVSSRSGMSYTPGGGIDGAIDYESKRPFDEAVVDELTAQKSALNFSSYLSRERQKRQVLWDAYWKHRREVADDIFKAECELYASARQHVLDNEFSDDEDVTQPPDLSQIPFKFTVRGAFDEPDPPPFIVPDPLEVERMALARARQYAAEQTQAHAHAQAHAQVRANAHAQYQAQQAAHVAALQAEQLRVQQEAQTRGRQMPPQHMRMQMSPPMMDMQRRQQQQQQQQRR